MRTIICFHDSDQQNQPKTHRLRYLVAMWKLAISALLWGGCIYLLSIPLPVGSGTTLPTLGSFFSPGQGFWRNAEALSTGSQNHALSLEGLEGPVKVVFDERFVPHIFAQSERDAYFTQGYVHAMFRMWQMDISTRAAAGELSAFLGERTVSYDLHQRRMGMGFAAENAVKGWKKYPEDYALIEAYADGFNAYLSSLDPSQYPVEYKLMGFTPEPWSVLKTALFTKSMASRLCLAEDDLEHTLLLRWLGKDRFDALFPQRNPIDDPVIPPGTHWDFTPITPPADSRREVNAIPGNSSGDIPTDRQEGSNNWAVSGSRTTSGRPILCNDPHLSLSLPSVWYEIQLVTPDFNAYGASLPGFPGVIIGFNQDIAWGETNTGHDVLDWYSIQWTDSTQSAYYLDGKVLPVSYRIEQVNIKGQPTVYDTVTYTYWGPVQKDGPHQGLAMRWLSHAVPDNRETLTFLGLPRARSYEDYVRALSYYQSPSQNFVFADKKGNIALRVGGKLPLRPDSGGRFVQDGSHTANGWQGFVPPDQNPATLNPERGFVSSANQTSTDTSYPYTYFGLFQDFRGRILNRYLSSMEHCTVKDMMSLQTNDISLKAEETLPHLLAQIKSEGPKSKYWVDVMSGWDYTYDSTRVAPVFFDLWYGILTDLIWDDFRSRQDSLYIRTPEAWRTDLLICNEEDSPEFDIDSTSATETFADLVNMSFTQAIAAYVLLDSTRHTWGGYHQTTVRHLANIKGFSRTIETSGQADALNATTESHGPSWRMIVQLTDPVEAYVVYPGGQSGNPGSPYYDNMITSWQHGKYFRPHYLLDPADLNSDALELTLTPASK